MRFDSEALNGLASLARHRVRPEEPGVLDELGAAQSLQARVDLADVDRPAEGPAIAIGTADDRMEVVKQGVQRFRLQPRRVRIRAGPELGDDRHAAVDRRLDEHSRADNAGILEAMGDALQRLLGGYQVVATPPGRRGPRPPPPPGWPAP